MNALTDWLCQYFDEVEPKEFYRAVFPAGELDQAESFTKGKYVGIAVEVTKDKKKTGKPKINRYSLTDDLDLVDRLTDSNNFCLMSPISYCGKERTADHARYLYAIAVDLDMIRERDGVPVGLIDLWNGHIMRAERIPRPTFIVSSGTGLHLYYCFEKAIPLLKNVSKQLQVFKKELTELCWNEGIVNLKSQKDIQQEGIYQGFRMVGTITKTGERARAFSTGDKVTMEYLNQFVTKESQVNDYTVKSDLTLREAEAKYPEWYERRIINGEKRGSWHISRNLYEWWKREIMQKAMVGHRYHCMRILAVYAKKCSMYDVKHNPEPVTADELERDAFEIMEYFESLTDDDKNHFTEGDVIDALESFNDDWITYPREVIEYRSAIEIKPKNRRNGRKQSDHLKRARAVQMIDYPDGEWRKNNGRKTKVDIVREWRLKNPNGKKADCVRETGLSRPTVYRHWAE